MSIKTNEFIDLVKSRRSIRAWQDKPVSEELLLQAIELATYAPNAGNQQNWHFYLILKRETINAIADAVQATAERIAAWPEAKTIGDIANRMLQRTAIFRSAPVGIAVAVKQYQSPIDQVLALKEKTDPQAKQMREWRNMASSKIQSVSSAIANLLLILHQMGLGGLWMTGPIQAKGDIEKILNVPSGEDIVAYIPVGYPGESPSPRERKPVKEICTVIQ
jgi:nitroreductase